MTNTTPYGETPYSQLLKLDADTLRARREAIRNLPDAEVTENVCHEYVALEAILTMWREPLK